MCVLCGVCDVVCMSVEERTGIGFLLSQFFSSIVCAKHYYCIIT